MLNCSQFFYLFDGHVVSQNISKKKPIFTSYQTANIPDVAFYDTTVSYESPSYDDPLGNVFNLGSDQMMDAMTNSQYEYEMK